MPFDHFVSEMIQKPDLRGSFHGPHTASGGSNFQIHETPEELAALFDATPTASIPTVDTAADAQRATSQQAKSRFGNMTEHQVFASLGLKETSSPVESIVHSDDDVEADNQKLVEYMAAEEDAHRIQGILGLGETFNADLILPLLRDPKQIYRDEKTFGTFLRDLLGDEAGRAFTDSYLQELARTIDDFQS
jgi:hypothetical protein